LLTTFAEHSSLSVQHSIWIIGKAILEAEPSIDEIRFVLPGRVAVDAVVVDLAGRRVRTLAAGREFAPGLNRLDWDGRDAAGRPVPVGVYLMRVRAGGEAGVQRVVVSR